MSLSPSNLPSQPQPSTLSPPLSPTLNLPLSTLRSQPSPLNPPLSTLNTGAGHYGADGKEQKSDVQAQIDMIDRVLDFGEVNPIPSA
jgi:hypothetical protein